MNPPPLGSEDLLEQLTEEREIHSPVYYITVHMINDTDEQSGEEIIQGEVQKSPKGALLTLWNFTFTNLLTSGYVHQSGSSSNT